MGSVATHTQAVPSSLCCHRHSAGATSSTLSPPPEPGPVHFAAGPWGVCEPGLTAAGTHGHGTGDSCCLVMQRGPGAALEALDGMSLPLGARPVAAVCGGWSGCCWDPSLALPAQPKLSPLLLGPSALPTAPAGGRAWQLCHCTHDIRLGWPPTHPRGVSAIGQLLQHRVTTSQRLWAPPSPQPMALWPHSLAGTAGVTPRLREPRLPTGRGEVPRLVAPRPCWQPRSFDEAARALVGFAHIAAAHYG